MKKLFFIVSILGFFAPFILFYLLKLPNDEIKIYALYLLPKFNLVYFLVLLVFFFGGLKYKWLQNAQILFVIFYIAFLNFKYFILSKIDVEKKINQFPNAKIVKITELKNFKNFIILYKEGPYAIIKIKQKQYKNPFNYIKDKGLQ